MTTILSMRDLNIPFEAMMDPDKHGYIQCDHCNGYGSSLKDPHHQDRCSKCGGSGLIKKEK
jgi:DnaJ-class molecular chaperone